MFNDDLVNEGYKKALLYSKNSYLKTLVENIKCDICKNMYDGMRIYKEKEKNVCISCYKNEKLRQEIPPSQWKKSNFVYD